MHNLLKGGCEKFERHQNICQALVDIGYLMSAFLQAVKGDSIGMNLGALTAEMKQTRRR